ncbi:MAG: outer membrane protein assembly factor BamA [Deltaproteobacteria bacterium]|nr:outer membrane protein assembly factor BamA [Deltaproteobacteria bacterium]
MTPGRLAVAGFLACLAFAGFLAPAAEAASFRVVAIDVQGARRVSADTIRQAMATREGGEFDVSRIREDVKAIYRLGYFRDVRIDAEEVPGGVRLTVIVAEKPIVGSVRIEGNKGVDTADIKGVVTVRERTLFQEEKVKESARKIVELYQNKGYYDATAVPEVTEDAEGAMRVAFRITEGPKLKIVKIRVSGNYYFGEKAIRKVMETTEKGFFSFITDSGTFKKDVIENDVRKIEALYQNNGFMDSKVFDPVFRRTAGGLEMTIRIYEGKQYRVGSVRFAGDSGVPEEDLRKSTRLAPGGVFSREVLLGDLLNLTTLLNDRGYAQALVSPVVEKRKDYPLADVTYKVDRGRKFRFGRVEIAGNTKTLDRVIRRNLDVADGTTYTATGLRESKEDLMRLGYFKDVKITTAPSSRPGEMDAKVEVQEGPTGTLSGGVGYSSLDKVFGVVQLSENNLFGRGWKAQLSAQFGARRTTYALDFRDPYFFDTDFSLLLSAYNTDVRYTDFQRKARGGKVGFGYQFTKFTSSNLVLRADTTRITEGGPAASTILQEEFRKGAQSTRSVGWSLARNTTDKPLDPSRGSVESVSVEYAGGPFGGDSQFVKYFLNGKVFFPVLGSTTISGNILWGHVISTVGGRVPIFERFFLGGPYSIRGFKSRTLSPADPNTGELIGGNKELVMNAEYLVPLLGEIGLKGVAFLDAGNTWRQGEWPWKGEKMRYAAGFGVRWYSPMGPLRLEWGLNLNPKPGEERRVVEFTIGTAF